MKIRFLKISEAVRSSLWFVPCLMVFAAIALSVVTLKVDVELQGELAWRLRWTYYGGADGARQVLATIASSAINVAGVVFSITMVTLTLAAQQFGPRLLRNFMRDRGNQVVLGTFIGSFLYCLLILRSIRGGDEDSFVPYVSVVTGILLAIFSLGVLIYFIHHVSDSIQAPSLIAAVGRDLERAIDRLFPQELGSDAKAHALSRVPEWRNSSRTIGVPGTASDYIQAIDNDSLFSVATESGIAIELLRRPGEFAIEGECIAVLHGDSQAEDIITDVQGCFLFGSQRTAAQDAQFAMEQLVEVAVRSLSAGINDPSTAINCLDRLGAALCKLSRRSFPSAERYDEQGVVRVVVPVLAFPDFLDTALDRIRQYGSASLPVLLRMLDVLCSIGRCARSEGSLYALQDHANRIRAAFALTTKTDYDLAALESRFRDTMQRLRERNEKMDCAGYPNLA